MGVINHNAVMATTWCGEEVLKVVKWVGSLHEHQKSLFVRHCNDYGYTTFVMLPDGNTEGLPHGNNCDIIRRLFIELLESSKYEEGSNPWRYLEVSYGEYGQSIVQGNNVNLME